MDITQFATYEDFLDSQVQPIDLYYLEDEEVVRQLVELGFRGTGEVVKREEFEAKKREAELLRQQQRNKGKLVLVGEKFHDLSPFLEALAQREEAHRTGKMMSIVFIRDRNAQGQEVSGYIDLAARFKNEAFEQYFSGKKKLIPKPTDLSFYNWSTGSAYASSSEHYQVTTDNDASVAFKNKRDRKMVFVDPARVTPGDNSSRTALHTDEYMQVVFYDHVTRITA
ncbi:uncharacterized protein MONBRDRAFT_21921 [Monosiga brevicollis MX1]|uniref:Cilia- and flagella-associated protein 299 n=1 Tax=Monosiga brevicollis TaxID=81824 RepID=A9UP03_MONBE|nr:uncharacterized protein MONBRDRAFT_21921 [Monosiga brevicollis MX1]EDQ92334.1 predicted protein [Monosiga brevicollis MX1]|eukprot:XP_001742096.1 hypothetical protein [Monosiga brevicollis MX1]